jgi:hypothetical protein
MTYHDKEVGGMDAVGLDTIVREQSLRKGKEEVK